MKTLSRSRRSKRGLWSGRYDRRLRCANARGQGRLPSRRGGALSRPTTTFTYDDAGNLLTLTDPVGNVTAWVYDNLDRVTSETNELSDARLYEYNALGQVTEITDRNGRVRTFEYNFWNQMVEEVWLDGVTTVNTLEFRYDLENRPLEADDDYSSYDFSYDNLSRVTQIDADHGGPKVRLFQEWNGNSNRTLLSAQIDVGSGYVNDFENVYSYDSLARLTKIEQDERSTGGSAVADKRIDFSYNASGFLSSITRYKALAGGSGNEVATTAFAYDNLDRTTDLTHSHDTTTIADYTLAYDVASRLTRFDFTSLVGNDGSVDYQYDDAWQLVDADHDFQADETYAYDENGNRTISGYVTGDNNQLLSDGTFDYAYDEEGNRVLKTNISTDHYTQYEYDHRNRLIAIVERDDQDAVLSEVRYVYDCFDRRIEKWIDSDGDESPEAEVQYVYDGQDIVLAFDDGDLTNRYLHGPLVDQILADEQIGGDVLWPLADHLHSVRDIVDSDGDVLNHITYSAYGEVVSETAIAVEHIFGFTGRERDEESGLYYYRARFYDPRIGRFVSEDPIGFAANDTNLSRYVGNGPTLWGDPNGLVQYDFSKQETWRLFGPMYFQTEEGREWYRQMTEYAQANPGNGWSQGPTFWGDMGLIAEYPAEAAAGFGKGLGTGGKAVVNGLGNAVVQTGTLGFGGRVEIVGVDDEDRFYGYDVSETIVNGSGQLVLGAGVGKLAQGGGYIGKAAFAWDAAGNAVTAGGGVADAAQNGLNWGNGAQIALGGLGLAGNAAGALSKGSDVLDDIPTGRLGPDGPNPRCGDGPSCFTAGTQVVVGVAAVEGIAMQEIAGPAQDAHAPWLDFAASIAFAGLGFAGEAVARRKRRKQQREESALFSHHAARRDQVNSQVRERVFADEQSFFSQGAETVLTAEALRRCASTEADNGEMRVARIFMARSARPVSRTRTRRPATDSKPLRRVWLAACLLISALFGVRAMVGSSIDGGPQAPTDAADAPQYVTKNIEDIRVDDFVLARDELGTEIGYRRVLQVFERQADHLRVLTLRDALGARQTLETTDEHPFWSISRKAWIDAGKLAVDEEVTGPSGEAHVIAATAYQPHPEGIRVYNFEVEGAHTYYVAAHGTRAPPVLVHNSEYCVGAGTNRGNGGRGGGPDHAATQQGITDHAGGDQEVRIYQDGPGSPYRIADNVDSQGRVHQVGDMRTRSGYSPSAPQRGAIEDIRSVVGDGTTIFYHDKLGQAPTLIDPDLQPGWRPAPPNQRMFTP